MENTKKILILVTILLYITTNLVSAITLPEINEAKKLIDTKTSCNSLSEDQLEIIGEYLMEQMHPGDSHEFMHKMMGLQEGSKDEKLFHINLAKAIYCGDNSNIESFSGMMRMSRMMGFDDMMNNGMMGNYGYGFGYSNLFNILYTILLLGLIALDYLWIVKLWKGKA